MLEFWIEMTFCSNLGCQNFMKNKIKFPEKYPENDV